MQTYLGELNTAMTIPSGAPHDLTDEQDLDTLLGALLFSVSHDLKSPLLTLSLSTELLSDEIAAAGERAQVAATTLRQGVEDVERMLEALTLVSRARRRTLNLMSVSLGTVLQGRLVLSDADLEQVRVYVDARSVAEALPALTAQQGAELRVRLEHGYVLLDGWLPEALIPPEERSALGALFGSLQQYAGTPVTALAALETQLRRGGGSVELDGLAVTVRLPQDERR